MKHVVVSVMSANDRLARCVGPTSEISPPNEAVTLAVAVTLVYACGDPLCDLPVRPGNRQLFATSAKSV